MQGLLNQINLSSLLNLIALEQKTGTLLISTKKFQNYSWVIFCEHGKIIYATNSLCDRLQLKRLRDYLYLYRIEQLIEQMPIDSLKATTILEYGLIWHLSQQGLISAAQARSIIQAMIEEVFFEILNLRQGFFIFEENLTLTPRAISFDQIILVKKVSKQLQQWKEFYPYINNVEDRPLIIDKLFVTQTLPQKAYNSLYHLADGKTSLRELARYLHRDILSIGKRIYPYIKQGFIQMLPANERPRLKQVNLSVSLACVSESSELLEELNCIINLQGYQLLKIPDLNKAWELLIEIKPDLIFFDAVDNYDLCAMLRQCTIFEQTPIIVLMDTQNFVTKIKFKSRGATDFLDRQWSQLEILLLLEQYLGLKI